MLVDGEPLPFNGDVEIVRVVVVDGSTGESVASARAFWSRGYGRGSGYDYTCWSGYRPDTGSFEAVYKGRGDKLEQTWKQVIDELAEKKRQTDLAKAQRDLELAQRQISRLRVGSVSTASE